MGNDRQQFGMGANVSSASNKKRRTPTLVPVLIDSGIGSSPQQCNQGSAPHHTSVLSLHLSGIGPAPQGSAPLHTIASNPLAGGIGPVPHPQSQPTTPTTADFISSYNKRDARAISNTTFETLDPALSDNINLENSQHISIE